MKLISELRKMVLAAEQSRHLLLQKFLSAKPFIAAQVYERFNTCGNKNCKCQRGELHGPFLWIYQLKKGQRVLSTSVAEDKRREAKEMAERYKAWTAQRQRLRELDLEIQEHLNAMEVLLEKEARDYATKRAPGRPKKDR